MFAFALFSFPFFISMLLVEFATAFDVSLRHATNSFVLSQRHYCTTRNAALRWPVSSKVTGTNRRSSSVTTFLSSTFPQYGDDSTNQSTSTNVLSYLSNEGKDLPPDMKELLERGTVEYLYGGDTNNSSDGKKMVDIEDVLEAVDLEYKISDRPVAIGDVTFNEQKLAAKEEEKWIYRILSVALFHQIPAPIVGLFLRRRPKGGGESLVLLEEDDPLQFCRHTLERDGWKAVSFPDGFRVQIRPRLICSTWKSYLPTRKASKERADELIQEADRTKLPEMINSSPRRNEVLLNTSTLDNEIPTSSSIKRPKKRIIPQLQDTLPYFPKKSKWRSLLQRFRRILQTQVQMLKKAGRAGAIACAIAYGFLKNSYWFCKKNWKW